jgi:hypothetical protein
MMKVHAYLAIAGFQGLFEDITKAIGVEPSQVWNAGEKVSPHYSHVIHERVWLLDSPEDPLETTPDAAVKSLLLRIPNRRAVHLLSREAKATLVIGITTFNEPPSFEIGADTLALLGETGARLGIDPYDLRDR